MKHQRKISRRNFIRVSTLGSGGLLLSIHHACAPSTRDRIAGEIHGLQVYVSIDTSGKVEIINPVPEIGQGVQVALPMLVAEELGAKWEDVIVRQADAGAEFGGYDQRAAGSNSVRVYWEPLRKAGAVARQLLVQAAALRWAVPPASCYVWEGRVYQKVNGRSLSFGELASEAACIDVPEQVNLKPATDFTLIGKSAPNPQIKAILNGSVVFGQDVRIPGMLYASIEKGATYGATVKSFSAERALALPGVQRAFQVSHHGNPERPYCREGIAVVGTSAWAVLEGRKALEIEWSAGPNNNESTDDLHRRCRQSVEVDRGVEVKNDGNVYAVQRQPEQGKLEAVYHLPFIGHVPMETVSCTIDLKEDGCELWSATQMPFADLNFLTRFLDLPEEKIKLHVTRIGGGFGRRLGPDFTIEAVKVAREIKQPVQLFWTREDDIRFDGYRPFSYHKLVATYTKDGAITSWLHRQAGTSRHAFRTNSAPHRSEFFPNHFPANLIHDFRQEYTLAKSNLSRSLIRAPGNNALAFVVESFTDELAYATHQDPLAFRLNLLGEQEQVFDFSEEDQTVISTGRMRRVLETAAATADWDIPLPTGRGRGIAGYFTFDTYVAHVAEVSVDETNGKLHIHRFTTAVDCGQVVNIDGVKAQTEGAIMDGISATLYQEITVVAGQTLQHNFDSYPLLRFPESPPEITVNIIDNDHPPTGIGEPPYPPVAPALCNAIFAATGRRIRSLPVGDQLKPVQTST